MGVNDSYSMVNGLGFGPSSTGEFKIGLFSSAGDNKFDLSATLTKALDICADDGGTALTAASIRSVRARMLIRTAVAGSPDLSVFGLQGQLKVGAVAVTSSGHMAGLWGYTETISGTSITGIYSGVYAMADLPTGATLAASSVLAGVEIGSNSLAGTSTGDMSCIYVSNPVAGTWDFLLQLGSSTGVVDTTTRTDAATCATNLKINLNGTTLYIPMIPAT